MVVNGVIDLINEVGIANLTVTSIVKRTRVSWGATQNLFGTKDGLMLAICDLSLQAIKDKLAAISCSDDSPPSQRVRTVVNCMREIYKMPVYLASAEVYRNPPRGKASRQRLTAMLHHGRSEMDRAWLRLFQASGLDQKDVIFVRHIINMALAGLGRDREWKDPISYEWHIPYDSFADGAVEFLIASIENFLVAERIRRPIRMVSGPQRRDRIQGTT